MGDRQFSFANLFALLVSFFFIAGLTLAATTQLSAERAVQECSNNMRQIGLAIMQYTNDSKGFFPRTIYQKDSADKPTFFTGVEAKNPFRAGGPKANDVSAALYLLLRTEDITPMVFVCPATTAGVDDFGGGRKTALDHSNFPSLDNLSYSYANPYANADALGSGFKMVQGMNPTFAVLADMNPGDKSLLFLTLDSNLDDVKKANSKNHGGEGQNVLYADFHVEFMMTPLSGVNRDNIYTCGESGMDPQTKKPFPNGGTAIVGSPAGIDDSVLLPAAGIETEPDQN